MITFNLLFGTFVAVWIVLLWSRRRFYSLFMKMRGPFGLPIIGMAHKFTNREDILKVFLDIEQQYGRAFVSWLGPFPFLVVAEPELSEAILTSPDLVDKAKFYDVLDDGTGSGLFSLKHPTWSTHRKLLNPTFNHKVLQSFLPIFNREANNLKDELSEFVETGEVDLTTILQKCTLNIAAQTTMGRQMASIRDHNVDLLHCFQSVLETMTSMIFSPWLRYRFFLRMKSNYSTYVKSKKRIRDFIKNLVREKRQQQEIQDSKDTPQLAEEDVNIKKNPNIFIDRAIELVKKGDFTWSDVENESNVIVFGAFETTANTVGYTIMFMAMFPKFQEKVFEELSSIIPSPDETTDISYEDIQHMTYMDMVISETMRVMAPVPVIGREAIRDVTLPNGVTLPKGLQVAIDIFNMHRDPKFWGDGATTFNPDNFLPANMAEKHPYLYIPFSKGIRNCIGWRYATLSTKVILSKLLRKYRFTTQFNFQDLQFVEDITIKLKKYPLMEIHLRDS